MRLVITDKLSFQSSIQFPTMKLTLLLVLINLIACIYGQNLTLSNQTTQTEFDMDMDIWQPTVISNPFMINLEFNQLNVIKVKICEQPTIDYNQSTKSETNWHQLGRINSMYPKGQCSSCWTGNIICISQSHWQLPMNNNELVLQNQLQITDCKQSDNYIVSEVKHYFQCT